ncbi:hypothetical protein BC832DRAFT_618429 [Gaertneriomyces semiglobifer]|nr:hypothetical protein BC832DRAFT_618429 [Gaertneriomyces semiglobifer]
MDWLGVLQSQLPVFRGRAAGLSVGSHATDDLVANEKKTYVQEGLLAGNLSGTGFAKHFHFASPALCKAELVRILEEIKEQYQHSKRGLNNNLRVAANNFSPDCIETAEWNMYWHNYQLAAKSKEEAILLKKRRRMAQERRITVEDELDAAQDIASMQSDVSEPLQQRESHAAEDADPVISLGAHDTQQGSDDAAIPPNFASPQASSEHDVEVIITTKDRESMTDNEGVMGPLGEDVAQSSKSYLEATVPGKHSGLLTETEVPKEQRETDVQRTSAIALFNRQIACSEQMERVESEHYELLVDELLEPCERLRPPLARSTLAELLMSPEKEDWSADEWIMFLEKEAIDGYADDNFSRKLVKLACEVALPFFEAFRDYGSVPKDLTERPFLNDFVHPGIKKALAWFAGVRYKWGEIPVMPTKQATGTQYNADGVLFSRYRPEIPIGTVENTHPFEGGKEEKYFYDLFKNGTNGVHLLNNVVTSEVVQGNRIPLGARTFQIQLFELNVEFQFMDYLGNYRLLQTGSATLPSSLPGAATFLEG